MQKNMKKKETKSRLSLGTRTHTRACSHEVDVQAFGFIYETALIKKEKLESCLVSTFQFFHLKVPFLAATAAFFIIFRFSLSSTIQFNDTVLHIPRLLCNFFRHFFRFLSQICVLLAQTKDKEVEISICSECVINIFPLIKFTVFFSLILLLPFSSFECSFAIGKS